MRRRLSPAQVLAVSFSALIVLGTCLLSLPVSSEAGQRLDLVDALFTATSAVCVTGLIVVDTPRAFSTFGEVVLLVLIQAGGLGYMTLSTSFGFLLGRRLSLAERVTLQESLQTDSLEGIAHFALTVLKTTLVIELAGAAVLTAWWARTFDLGEAAHLAVFHAVSAFNNAGFSLFSDNLMAFRGDLVVNLVVGVLVFLGGIGFFVVREVWQTRSVSRLSMHSRLVLSVTMMLIAAGTVGLLVLEWGNPRTLGPLGVGEKVLAASFQAVSPRTAGFNTIDVGGMTVPALFLLMALMFIGAGPGSTAGGVKVSTFGVTVLALWAMVRGSGAPVVFGRRIPAETVARAFFICLISFLVLNVVGAVLLVVERRELLATLFETSSAFGTVGLSMGEGAPVSLAGHFSPVGKALLTAMMFMGRVGPLTLAIALAGRRERSRVRYPEGRVLIG
jgi:trk system potassium uptake protein TrkH